MPENAEVEQDWEAVPAGARLLLTGIDGEPETVVTRCLEANGWRVRIENELSGVVHALRQWSPRAMLLAASGDFTADFERLRVLLEIRPHRRMPVLVLAKGGHLIGFASLVYSGAAAVFPSGTDPARVHRRLVKLIGRPAGAHAYQPVEKD